MASLLKKQILKHLSRFTKNLSLDKINLSTFKGEGELSSLELDEIVLTDLLELPSWVRLTSAWCNKVAFRIQWTRLKNVPIEITLDEVKVEIETCEELRSLSAQQGLSAYGGTTKYSFINRVIDGMTISVNKMSITFRTPTFEASIDVIKILVESKSPEWEKEELSKTMKKDKAKEQILIFKGLEWQSLKLEAKSIKDSGLPPLRLLTVRSRCRLTIKKRMSDCFVMGCKLLLILEEGLWVLTDSQLKAVLHFVESLSGLVQKANETTRIKKAARKLNMLPEYHAQISQQEQAESSFGILDVVETSYHFLGRRINLHFSDDPGAGRSFHPPLCDGGNVLLQITSLRVDYYPYHLAADDRSKWPGYNNSSSCHLRWLTDAQTSFKNSLLHLIESSNQSTPTNKGHDCSNSEENGVIKNDSSSSPTSIKKYVLSNLAKVMTSCVILRVDDFTVFRVSTHSKQVPKEFLKGDRHACPPDSSLVHAEFTYYYYPGDIAFPLPPPKFYVQVNPVVMNFDPNTILWLNSFSLNLHHSLHPKPEPASHLNYIDVKIEAIMPKVVFERLVEPSCGQRDRPKSLHFQVSRMLITNIRSSDGCSRADLAKCIHACQLRSLFFGQEFPSKQGDLTVITEKFSDHVQSKDNVRNQVESLPVSSIEDLVGKLSKTLLWIEARDVWCINLEPLWGDFYGARGVAQNRPVPFLDAFSLKLWVYLNLSDLQSENVAKAPNIHALASISNLVSVQLNHYQLLFLLRLADELTELVTILELDTLRITKKESGAVVVGAVLPQLEVTLVMPSQTPGKESSAADLESVIPDSSSLADDIVTNPSIQWNPVLTTNLQDGGVYKRENSLSATSPPSDRVSVDAFSSPKIDSPLKTFNNMIGFTSMKKGFTNITNLIDNALKTDDISETFSIRSDDSSDSDNFVLKPGVNDVIFHGELLDTVLDKIDYGCEAMEDCDNQSGATMSITTPSENQSNISLYKRRDLISIATFKLGQVEFVQQSQGLSSTIKAHVSNVAVEECPVIPWDEFQNKFKTRSRGWTEVCDYPAVKPRIKLRKDHFVKSGDSKLWSGTKNTPLFDDFVEVKLSDINVIMNTPTVSSIAEFFVDDVVTPPLPLKTTIENVEVNLIEDRTGSTAGPSNPINVKITRLRLSRNSDGVLVIEPTVPQESSPVTEEVSDLKTENDDLRSEILVLRRQLVAIDRLNEENHQLRKCEEEARELRSSLHEAQERISTLLEEKQNLLEDVRSFQSSRGEGRHQSSGKR